MKVRDSGMPPESSWSSFFEVEKILDFMMIDKSIGNLMEIGCGYGTFTISAAKRISSKLYAIDIEQEMIDITLEKANQSGLTNIDFIRRDITANGAGLPENSLDYVLLFNILHHENPLELLNETYRVLKHNGLAGIIHWRTDITTPRGPDISIRPNPQQCAEWATIAGFEVFKTPEILEPYHYGLIIKKV